MVKQSRKPVEFIQPDECPFCDDKWAENDQTPFAPGEVLAVTPDQFQRHVGHHLQQYALFALPRRNLNENLSLATGKLVASFQDRDTLSQGFRWVREDCGRGWNIISRKRGTFIAIAYFIELYRHSMKYSLLHIIDKPSSAVKFVCFSPDGKLLASSSDDCTVRVWEVETGTQVRWVAGHREMISAIVFSSDGVFIVWGSTDCRLRVWQLTGEGEGIFLFYPSAPVCSVALSPNAALVAAGLANNNAHIWNVRSQSAIIELKRHTGPIFCVAFSPNGVFLATGSSDHTVILWEVGTGDVLLTLGFDTGCISSIAIAPNSELLAVGFVNQNDIFLIGRKSGVIQHTLRGHEGGINSMAFSPNSKVLLSGSRDNTACCWDVENGTLIQILAEQGGPVFSTATSRDGMTLATGDDMRIYVWRASR